MAAKKTAARKPAAVKVYKSFGQLAKAWGAGAVRGLRLDVRERDGEVVVTDVAGNVRLRLTTVTAVRQLAERSGARFARVLFDGIEVQ